MYMLRFDMRAPAFGAPTTDLYACALEMATFVESRGALTAVVCEHHTMADGYLPSPMVLATATRDGTPSARVVLCKDIVAPPGYVQFYTNFQSRKGRELAENPRAALVMHWDHLHRQVRVNTLVKHFCVI